MFNFFSKLSCLSYPIKRIAPARQNFLTQLSMFTMRPFQTVAKSQAAELDWSLVRKDGYSVQEHVIANHSRVIVGREIQGVFYSDPIIMTKAAWAKLKYLKIKPIENGRRNIYIIPFPNSGFSAHLGRKRMNLDYITIVTNKKTSQIVTAFPSGRTPKFPKNYIPILVTRPHALRR